MGIDTLASIGIGMNPNLIDAGGFLLSWHGVFTFIAVAVAVYLVVRWGTREGMVADVLYSASMWAIIGGVIGARLLHVIDFWDEVYQHDFIRVFQVWQGGIAIFRGHLRRICRRVAVSADTQFRRIPGLVAPLLIRIRRTEPGGPATHRAPGRCHGAGAAGGDGYRPHRGT